MYWSAALAACSCAMAGAFAPGYEAAARLGGLPSAPAAAGLLRTSARAKSLRNKLALSRVTGEEDERGGGKGARATPCVRICRYKRDFYGGIVCIGCFREAHEIAHWNTFSGKDPLHPALPRSACLDPMCARHHPQIKSVHGHTQTQTIEDRCLSSNLTTLSLTTQNYLPYHLLLRSGPQLSHMSRARDILKCRSGNYRLGGDATAKKMLSVVLKHQNLGSHLCLPST